MKKFVIATFLLLASITNALAVDLFYSSQAKDWAVRGIPQRDKLSPVCSATFVWNDGSEFNMISDLADGELYILFLNNSWNISDPVNQYYDFRLNVHYSGTVRGLNGTYELLSKNAIRVRNLKPEMLEMFAEANEMRFIMPGNIVNARVLLNGTQQAASKMLDCIKAFRK